MLAKQREMVGELTAQVKSRLAALPGCHDWDHTLRVVHNARHLARVEDADALVVECGALLHDIGRAEELTAAGKSKTCHAALGAEMAPAILAAAGFVDPGFVARVVECVRAHRYRRREGAPPESLEAKVVYDADKLDSIGMVGLGRAFHFAGRIGARLHNTEDEATAAKSYSREDTAYREFLVKLRHVPERMLTREGRRLAEVRHQRMLRFFAEFAEECAGPENGKS